MRIRLAPAVAAAAALCACQKGEPAASAPAPLPPAAVAPAPGQAIHGKVLEKIDAGGYSYLRLGGAGGESWSAVPQSTVAVGTEVEIAVQMPMDGFESKTLNRKFDRLYFGTISTGGAAPAPAAPAVPAAPAQGFVAQAVAGSAAGGSNPHATVNDPAAGVTGPIKVEKAQGKEAQTVADVFAKKGQLKDRPVVVRGKVVKYNEGILGKNWVHLKDGTGGAGADDITVTTQGKVALGEVITVRGVVHLDRDFGAGYAYAVLIEDATVEKVGL